MLSIVTFPGSDYVCGPKGDCCAANNNDLGKVTGQIEYGALVYIQKPFFDVVLIYTNVEFIA